MKRSLLLICAILTDLTLTAHAAPDKYPERWNYVPANLGTDKGLQTLLDVLKQSKEVGCTHILLTEGRALRDADDIEFLARAEKVKAFARENQLTLVPSVFSFGYSGRYLGFDPNLCAGLPVKNMPFVARDGKAEADPALAVDVSRVKAGADSTSGSIVMRPFTHYRVTFSAKGAMSGDADEHIHISARVSDRWLSRRNLDRRQEGGQTIYETTFNSLEGKEGNVLINGTAENIKIEPAGLLMVIRRALCPLTVASADGQTVYEERKDFETVADPKLSTDGEFVFTHESPPIRLTANSRIKNGDKLRVSFFHAYRLGGDQDVISMEDPKVGDIMEKDVAAIAKVWQPAGVFMNFDEIRIGGWETPDRKPGEILAAQVKRGCDMIRKQAPNAKIYTWSDMFTPLHNARPYSVKRFYYLVNGTWDGGWEGLPKDVTIMNWYAPTADGVKFFADRGHAQVLCGYYDGTTTEQMKKNISSWMLVSQGVPHVQGFMYTTWRKNYTHMKEYFDLVDAFTQWGNANAVKPAEKIPGATD